MNKIRELFLQRPILSSALVLAVFLLPLFIIFVFTYGKTNVILVVAPKDAFISINGGSGRHGRNMLEPGKYEVTVSRDGFKSHKEVTDVGRQDMRIPIVLEPVSDEAWEYVKNHPEQYRDVEAVAGEIAQREGEAFRQQNPIVDHLPYRSLIFDIDYKLTEDEDDVTLIITADTEVDREYALDQIRNWGYDPKDFQIEYN